MCLNTLIYPVVFVSLFMFIGCASTTKMEELSSEVYKLNTKIDQIEENVSVLKPEIERIKNEAVRANKRLDNQQSVLYRK